MVGTVVDVCVVEFEIIAVYGVNVAEQEVVGSPIVLVRLSEGTLISQGARRTNFTDLLVKIPFPIH